MATSRHVGDVGQRIELEATCIGATIVDGRFGVSTLVKLRDGTGNVFAWFASGVRTDEFEPGRSYSLAGTVKAHKEFRGVPETHLTRVRMETQHAFSFGHDDDRMEKEIGDYPDPPEWHPGEKF